MESPPRDRNPRTENVSVNVYDSMMKARFLSIVEMPAWSCTDRRATCIRSAASTMEVKAKASGSGQEEGGMKGIRQLADHLDISIGTVSRALNGRSDVNPETRKRVLQAAE